MNPKDIQGSAKPNLSVLPFAPLLEVIAALTEGRRKYGPWNWRAEKVSETIYADAAIRHLMQFIAGEDVDPDSGVHHISKAIAGLLVVRDAQLHGCSIDDRYVNQSLNIDAIKEQIVGVIEKYPNPVESDLPPRVTDSDRVDLEPEAVDACHAECCASTPVLNEAAIGSKVRNRKGLESVLERNTGSKQFCYQYQDGGILRTVDENGRFHGTNRSDSEFDVVDLYPNPEHPFKGTSPSQTMVELAEKLANYYGFHDLTVTENRSVTRSWSDTVAGGGPYTIKPEDVGKVAVCRDGEQVSIREFDDESGTTWPVTYQGKYAEDCCTLTGFASADADYDEDDEVEQMDSDIVRVYHKGTP